MSQSCVCCVWLCLCAGVEKFVDVIFSLAFLCCCCSLDIINVVMCNGRWSYTTASKLIKFSPFVRGYTLTRTEPNRIFRWFFRSFFFSLPQYFIFCFLLANICLLLTLSSCVVLCRLVETFPQANSSFEVSIEYLRVFRSVFVCALRFVFASESFKRFTFIIIIICCNFSSLNKFLGHFCPVNWSFLCFPFLIDDQPQPNESWLLLAFFDALHNKSCIFSNVAAKMGKKHTQNFVDLWTKKSSSKATRNRKLKIVLAKGFPKLRSKANFSIVFHLFIFGIFFMLFISHEWHNKLGFHWNGKRWVLWKWKMRWEECGLDEWKAIYLNWIKVNPATISK